jgi:hypothetical protein
MCGGGNMHLDYMCVYYMHLIILLYINACDMWTGGEGVMEKKIQKLKINGGT